MGGASGWNRCRYQMRAPGSAAEMTHVSARSRTDGRGTEGSLRPHGRDTRASLTYGLSTQVRELVLCQQHASSRGGILVLTERLFFDLQHMESATWHQVDFNSFMENTGMPCWRGGFWVMEGFVKLLQCLVQGPYRHLPSLWQTQWDCTDPGGSNGY